MKATYGSNNGSCTDVTSERTVAIGDCVNEQGRWTKYTCGASPNTPNVLWFFTNAKLNFLFPSQSWQTFWPSFPATQRVLWDW